MDIRGLLAVVGKSGVTDYQSMAMFEDGCISFNNGRVLGRVDTPDFPVSCVVELGKLGTMLKAAEASGAIKSVHTTEKSLIVKAGGFRGHLPTLQPESYPPLPEAIPLAEEQNTLLKAIQGVKPFMGDRQPWMQGVFLKGGFAYATNGTVLVRAATGLDCKGSLLLPSGIDALSKLEEVSEWGEADGAFVVMWESGWMRLMCSSLAWPGAAITMLDEVPIKNEVSATWGDKLAGLISLADNFGIIIIEKGGAHLEGSMGGKVEIDNLVATPRGYKATDLGMISGLLHWCDFEIKPARFSGNGVAGVIIGKDL